MKPHFLVKKIILGNSQNYFECDHEVLSKTWQTRIYNDNLTQCHIKTLQYMPQFAKVNALILYLIKIGSRLEIIYEAILCNVRLNLTVFDI